MAVKHYFRDGKAVCGMVPKKNDLLMADTIADVTCKKCLKKLDVPVKEVAEPEVDVMADIEDLDNDELKDGDDLFPGVDDEEEDEDVWPDEEEEDEDVWPEDSEKDEDADEDAWPEEE